MTSPIFTYGSLMFPQVWQRVVRGTYRFAPASANNYARFAVKGQTYPGMIALQGANVQGLVYFDVTPADIALLDAFEGPEYQRTDIDVQLDNGNKVTASAYIYIDGSGLSKSAWHPGQFQVQQFIAAFCDPGSIE